MDLVKVGIFAIACAILGLIGGIAARSIFAGIILAVFVFIGWILWRLFKIQSSKEETKDTSEKER